MVFFLGGCSQRRHLTKQTGDLSPVFEFLGPQDQCSRDATVQNFFHEPVMKKWAAKMSPLFRKPEKTTTKRRHDNRIFVQDTWNHKKKYPWITSCQLPCLTVEIVWNSCTPTKPAVDTFRKNTCTSPSKLIMRASLFWVGFPTLVPSTCWTLFQATSRTFFAALVESEAQIPAENPSCFVRQFPCPYPKHGHFSSTMALMYFAILFF